jgi:tRNA dimethylallyltransferase
MLPRIVCIVGPTASGKTSLSLRCAHLCNGEIVSADSRQVYEGLDIGSGKILPKEMQGIHHHMLDIADPRTVYTASDFVRDGRAAIGGILQRKNIPILVGGTGFYIDALLGRISLAEVPANETLRSELSKKNTTELFADLEAKDPVRAASIDRNNPRRLVRALEILSVLEKVPTERSEPIYDVVWIGTQHERSVLRARIRARLDERLAQGMLAEAQLLHAQGLSFERMYDLGLEYSYMASHLEENLSYSEMIEQLDTAIGRYAKRQITYFKRNTHIHWVDPATVTDVELRTLFATH